ncbi:MAG: hypothetical protein IIV23_11525 [Ruminococcus sp.]|nr:hypothetical protein [Ruminococcus sp.]
MEIYLVPLKNVPQRFEIDLSGKEYIVQCRWNPEMPSWTVDFADAATGAWLFRDLPLTAGIDLLQQYQHLVTGSLFIYTDGDENSPPTQENLGAESNLYYITEDENE